MLLLFQAPSSLCGKEDELDSDQIVFDWDQPGFGQGFTQEQVDGTYESFYLLCQSTITLSSIHTRKPFKSLFTLQHHSFLL